MIFPIAYRQVCVYCGTVTDTFSCSPCGEYDGVMTFAQAAEYMPEEFGYLMEEL